jgi:hypothetical protein
MRAGSGRIGVSEGHGVRVTRAGRFGAAWGPAVGLAVALTLLCGAPRADAEEPEPRVEVAPGVYLASFSKDGPPTADGVRQSAPDGASASQAAPRTPFIVGGRGTTIKRWPWMAEIQYLFPSPDDPIKRHHCGGSVVAPRVVVTAAHCMTLGASRFERPPSEFKVVTGRTKLKSERGREHRIADYYWFVDKQGEPLWNSDTVAWDAVFLLLDSPSGRATIKLAGADEAAVWAPGQRAFVAGWGKTRAGTDDEAARGRFSNVLLQARIRMIADPDCQAVYGPQLIPELMVCAGLPRGRADACGADSGGPLVVPIAGGGRRLVGDVSFAAGCGLPRVPGVYGRIAADPMRQALAVGIEAVAGADVVGSGAMPPNRFGFAHRKLRYRQGGARLRLRVPGAGQLRLHRTRRLRGALAHPRMAGPARLRLEPRPRLRRRLARAEGTKSQKVKLRAKVTYTPLNGEPRTTSRPIRLLRHRSR